MAVKCNDREKSTDKLKPTIKNYMFNYIKEGSFQWIIRFTNLGIQEFLEGLTRPSVINTIVIMSYSSLCCCVTVIKTHGSESRGQGGSSKRHPDGLETHTHEYYTCTRVVKIENAITKKP